MAYLLNSSYCLITMSYNLKLHFLGATQTVTGSKTLLEYQGKKYLIDCGLFQGPYELRKQNWDPFEIASEVNSVILTHSHIDHCGFLPKLVKDGFRGSVFCSPASLDLARILLLDSAYLQEEDARFAQQTKHSRYENPLPLYTIQDAQVSLKHLKSTPYHKWVQLDQGLSFQFIRSGHILGSNYVQISFMTEQGPKLLTFSGDVGNGRSFILEDPEVLKETDYLIMESTYGDRRQDRSDPRPLLKSIVEKVTSRGGTLIIPAFAVGRTQEILFLLSEMNIKVPIYLDSPMAQEATEIYQSYPEELKKKFSKGIMQNALQKLNFKEIRSSDESMLLCMSDEPKVVISAAGMLTGGRVLHHLKTKLPQEKNGVLFVGFQAQGTKGLLLKNGLRRIRLHHQDVDVEAEIFSMDNLSAHADSDDIIDWIQKLIKKPQKIFLNHGEVNSMQTLAYRIRTELNIEPVLPLSTEEYNLN